MTDADIMAEIRRERRRTLLTVAKAARETAGHAARETARHCPDVLGASVVLAAFADRLENLARETV